ncbi:aldose epimerase family protein [Flammeovirga kamogawensis]|uniref:Aldose 1-epimerase n=1 Tax=Flammeovirga kamogawensis TaxID=373891 RepID=A0ABX8H3P0_9BACT|nr:aldose epimerase family protein [Flammeovirga kamogawensis]MBB6460363.1 aldose 1-epimerase [Flammeovirga kamogawensis]QWG10172.1 galactose mutarotase [Flammeovirga kamogawensis]TRX64624.1 galactose mutarotase [Flammeovirga kamogawensis]
MIKQQLFGVYEGHKVHLYTLQNTNGMTVKIMTLGATITSIQVPNKNNELTEVACGFDQLDGYFSTAYKANAPYFGCTVGRFASRIKDGKFQVDGAEYSLAVNDGSNHLHGGLKGLDKQIWKCINQASATEKESITFKKNSLHLEEGFPGNVEIEVTFTLTKNNALQIIYNAITDHKTPISLTNHTYFNLSGFKETVGNHTAKILADAFLKADHTNVPVGEIEEVKNTVLDLNQGRLLSEVFAELPTGCEHYYLFNEVETLKEVATFDHSKTGITLQIQTTEPGMLFYTGYFTSNDLKRETGDQFGRYRAFCCETHRYPNGPNIKDAPNAFTTPDEPYNSTTVYQFSTK